MAKTKKSKSVFMKSDTEINLAKAEALNKFNEQIIADLEAKLYIAYREQEEMLKELKRWLDAFSYTFKQQEEHAGKITSEDVTYHAKLISKIMEHKFSYKSKMEEF